MSLREFEWAAFLHGPCLEFLPLYNWPGRNEDIPKRQSNCPMIETMNPKEMEISPRNLKLREGKCANHRGNLSLGKIFHAVLTTSQYPDETEAQTMMGQQWVWPCLNQVCLDMHILVLYVSFYLTSEAWSRGHPWIYSPLFPMWPHWKHPLFLLSIINLAVLIG